jgi:hypothetical protein
MALLPALLLRSRSPIVLRRPMLLGTTLLLLLGVTTATTPVRVDTVAGPVVGRRMSWRGRLIEEFLGVPYAAPPLGPYRWRPPQPLEPWTVPRNATGMPPACPQNPPQSHVRVPAFPDQEPRVPWSEDCLVVNVWAPSNRYSRLLPVLLWLYGGGWQEGDAAQPLYNGRNLTSTQDVVLVVVNWRVNVFGFLGMQALAAEEAKLSGQATTGFYGQQDQRAAMEWARDNVAKFGGDPQKVTLWGQSAGASSICYHLLLPASQGLFQRAIVDSSCDERSLSAGGRPIPATAPYGIARRWGCAETNLTCLRSIPVSRAFPSLLLSRGGCHSRVHRDHGDSITCTHLPPAFALHPAWAGRFHLWRSPFWLGLSYVTPAPATTHCGWKRLDRRPSSTPLSTWTTAARRWFTRNGSTPCGIHRSSPPARVSAPCPFRLWAVVLTEILLFHACSCQEILRMGTACARLHDAAVERRQFHESRALHVRLDA